MQSCFCRNIWQSITESRICCVTYLLTLFELPSLKDLLSSSDYANPSVWHPGWIFCPPLSLFNNSNENNYKTGNWIAALTRRFSFGEKGWWTQHSSVWPEKYRKPRTEILKLNTKHLKQKSENINRNRTFQMRTAQLVGWTLDSLLIGYSLVQLEGEGSPLKISKDSGTIFRNILRSVGANRKHCTAFLFFKISETDKSWSMAQSFCLYRSEKNPSFVADLKPPTTVPSDRNKCV